MNSLSGTGKRFDGLSAMRLLKIIDTEIVEQEIKPRSRW